MFVTQFCFEEQSLSLLMYDINTWRYSWKARFDLVPSLSVFSAWYSDYTKLKNHQWYADFLKDFFLFYNITWYLLLC